MPLYNPTNALGVTTATTLALGGATIGTNALAVTGTAAISGQIQTAAGSVSLPALWATDADSGIFFNGNTTRFAVDGTAVVSVQGGGTWLRVGAGSIGFTNSQDSGTGTLDLYLTRAGAASLQLGGPDIDTAPVAQTLRTQGALAGGTSNVAGANWTFIASPGKGTGAGGAFIFQTAPAGSTGTVVGTPTTALTLDSTQLATFAGAMSSVGSHTFTTATSGIVLKRGANGLCGTFVANGITPVVVSNSNYAITDAVIISLNTVGGTVGVQPHVSSNSGGTSFSVVCTASDTSTYNYAIIKNAA